MAPSRLTDSQKRELVERYRSGESTAALAAAFGCSVNTVSRTARALLTPEAYEALKKERARGGGAASQAALESGSQAAVQSDRIQAEATPAEPIDDQDPATLALDDADDFGDALEDAGEADEEHEPEQEFHTVAVLTGQISLEMESPAPDCRPLGPGVLPESVYMLVDKLVELDPQPLSAFKDLGALVAADQDRQAIGLYASPRTAKRQCGRNQRVIKVPDSQVFERTSRYLLARGITRLVLDGSLIALDG
ncbi:hypothetical protein SynWH8101_2268 [Synechococcus sp. WH 8101]|uniref:helix-turn-helix domain-containing protein n=1 Tax=Synechococcus sp. WH 8101 TaxID=59932 RepID=UPI00102351C1|nr:helix-turn-helix domain-containing protein [Synechococcus sp. WH 8101]QBE69846.1 hypothetical protein SynWH8101_2268 [Synechococcus sp. WH 8101]QNI46105.1 hypothetical protein SynRCC2555_02327 [Synechococcus sp. WH 8101]